MTGSKQGHKRYWTRKKLTKLIEDNQSVTLIHLNNKTCYYFGSLSHKEDGFYFENIFKDEEVTNLRIPIRAVTVIDKEIVFDDDYKNGLKYFLSPLTYISEALA